MEAEKIKTYDKGRGVGWWRILVPTSFKQSKRSRHQN